MRLDASGCKWQDQGLSMTWSWLELLHSDSTWEKTSIWLMGKLKTPSILSQGEDLCK